MHVYEDVYGTVDGRDVTVVTHAAGADYTHCNGWKNSP